jgi:hypothetical protein
MTKRPIADIFDLSDYLTREQRQQGLRVVRMGITTRLVLHGTTVATWDSLVSPAEIREEADIWMPKELRI